MFCVMWASTPSLHHNVYRRYDVGLARGKIFVLGYIPCGLRYIAVRFFRGFVAGLSLYSSCIRWQRQEEKKISTYGDIMTDVQGCLH